jgi:gluconolactonase
MTLDDIVTAGTVPEVLGDGYGFTEGPAADRGGNVYFSDGRNNSIHRWEPGRPVTLFTDNSTDAIGMMFNAQGELYVCEGAAHRIVAYDVRTRGDCPNSRASENGTVPSGTSGGLSQFSSDENGTVPLRPAKRILCSEISGQHFNEPNDLAIDFHGGFYFSDPNYQHHGQPTVMKQDVYYCSAEGRVARVSTVCFKPNGVLLSADDRTLYVADARGQCIYRYEIIRPGQLVSEQLWIDQLGANPDGLTLDQHGNLYICCGKAGLKIFDRDARPVGQLNVHAANCCFGAADFRTLCIASVDKFLGLRTNVTGLKPLPLRVPKKVQPSTASRPASGPCPT